MFVVLVVRPAYPGNSLAQSLVSATRQCMCIGKALLVQEMGMMRVKRLLERKTRGLWNSFRCLFIALPRRCRLPVVPRGS